MKIKFLSLLFILTFAPIARATELPTIFKVPFTVGGQFYDYQNYQQIPYLHGGLDLVAPDGTEVFTPVGGRISVNIYKIRAGTSPHQFKYERRPFKHNEVSYTRYLEVSIIDENGNNWMFRHIDPKSISSEVFSMAQNGKKVQPGIFIGRVARWISPVKPEPSLYNHIHLEIVASSGYYLNPADFVATNRDYYPPTVHGIYLVTFDRDLAFSQYPRPVVNGKISIIAGVTDRMNRAEYQHSVYSAQVELLHYVNQTQSWEKIKDYQAYKFDQLPIIGDRTQLSNVIYRDSIVVGQRRIYANGNDGPRFFLLNLTAGDTNLGYDRNNGLNTKDIANGYYLLKVVVSDHAGNTRTQFQYFVVDNLI